MMVTISPESQLMITPSEVIEHLFCPRFTYFMNCMNIPQHEELRYKVQKGREIHKWKERINKDYTWKKIGCVSRDHSVYLASHKLRVRGIVDEVLTLQDGTLAPLDYKYAEYKEYTFKTHTIQSTLYAMLIKEIYEKPVKRGFICYVRKGSTIKEIEYKERDFKYAGSTLDEIFEIIQRGFYPKRTKSKAKCLDCCYKNICV